MYKRWLTVSIGLLAAIFLISSIFIFGGNGTIKRGIKIEGVNYSGLSRADAVNKLNLTYNEKSKNSKLTLKYGGKTWQIPFDDIKVKYDIDTAADSAYSIGNTKNQFSNMAESIAAMFGKHNIRVKIGYDKQALIKVLNKIGKEIGSPSKNASFIVNEDKSLTLVPEESGIKLNTSKAIGEIEASFAASNNSPVELAVINDLPKYTKENLKDIKDQIGYCKTTFNSSEASRSSNIKNALGNISGTILFPGEAFSLNSILGPRNEENGYQEAPVILNNKLVPGLGGGICQVATTLYGAVLKSSMQVVERYHHTFPPKYVPVGQDATIAGDHMDFKFKNTLNSPVFIYAGTENSKIEVRIYSKNINPGNTIKLESQILEVEEPGPSDIIMDTSLPNEEIKVERDPQKGYRVSVYRCVYSGGALIKRENISNDHYKAINGIVKIGTGM